MSRRHYIQVLLLWIMLILLGSFEMKGQDRPFSREIKDRINAQKIAHITDALQLTATEAQLFWPVYNEYESKIDSLGKHTKMKALGKEKAALSLSDKEARDIISIRLDAAEEELRLKRVYIQKYLKILPAQKVVALPEAERSFRQMLVRRVSDRMEPRRRPLGRGQE